MDGGDGYTTMQIYLMALNCTLKHGYNDKLYVKYILPQFLKWEKKIFKNKEIRINLHIICIIPSGPYSWQLNLLLDLSEDILGNKIVHIGNPLTGRAVLCVFQSLSFGSI